MLPKLKANWMDHADIVRRVFIVEYHLACATDNIIPGTDMVKGFTVHGEDIMIEDIRKSIVAKEKVGKYKAKTFLGKVNDMCWAALQPVQYNIKFEIHIDRKTCICTM